MVKFKDFSMPLGAFQVLVKANLIFKDFSRQSCIFKYFSSLCKPYEDALLNDHLNHPSKSHQGFRFFSRLVGRSEPWSKKMVGHFLK